MYAQDMMLEVTVDGANVVGPVSLDQVRRGVAEGRVPPTAHARPIGTNAWLPVQRFLGNAGSAAGHAHAPAGYPPAGYAPVGYPPAGYPAAGYAPPPRPPPPPPPAAARPAWPQAGPAQAHVPAAQAYAPAAAPVAHPAPPAAPSQADLGELRALILEAQQRLASLRAECSSTEEAIEIQSFGFYQTRYGFESSKLYVDRLKEIRDAQKAMIKAEKAAVCDAQWTVSGSAAEGRKMVQQQIKLMLRAFNGEADAAIAKVRYDNVVTLEQRIRKACDDINKLGASKKVEITDAYAELKLGELRLVHEHREKVQEEKEEQKRIRETMREEQKAAEEIERAQSEAEAEEARFQKALEKARAELAESTGKQHDKLEGLVTKLETELKDAIDRKAKAIARAQLTKSGHVYVLSNLGSFGEGVYKIGMTRRLEPLERVDELGDASVPFPFDVHAIIYCEDAPKLENALHKAFAHRRVNRVNLRKEYFRVTLDEVRTEVEKLHGLVTFTLSAEAEEFRKTMAAMDAVGEGGADEG